ncbi:MAG: hypothetical protein UT50_C0004G0042 [Candidatus Moranbacteria bacterium GW2011_GWA2_39_41]|nr:MAG: hypothetical protein UT50_C0004G0042 [Candidatus Moranbacteria bacterium GW2011_GWA2_39_41]
MSKQLIKQSFLLALGEGIYISLVALLMFGVQKWFGSKPDSAVIAPIAFLLLLVISAAISGALILGKPAMLYLDGQKKDALKLFSLTVGWLIVLLVIAFTIVAMQ